MPRVSPLPIAPPPGVVKTDSARAIEGRWSDSNMIRFNRGRPEKRGGWSKAFVTPTSGTPRAMHAWRDNSFNNYMAAGTYRKLYVYDPDGDQNDITPYRSTGTLGNNPFTTTAASAIVSVAHAGHGANPGDTITFSGSTAVGGITPNGTFIVLTVTNANAYTFTFTSNASSTATNGGAAVAFSYEVSVGTELGAYGLGWGVGGWGLGTWGTAHSASTIFIEPRIWSLDHFGQLLLASYNGGTLYSFDPTASQPWARAAAVATAPTDIRAMFVTPERFVFALRAGMIVSWSDQNTIDGWTPGTGHTTGSRTLTEGTKLVSGRVLGPFVSLVWTDAALYLFQYTGSQFVYNSSLAGKDCGLIAPNAAVTVDGVAYWMGRKDFWMYNGRIQRMPNADDIDRYVFDDLSDGTLYQCHAVYNPDFHEIEFFYTAIGETTPTKSVVFDIDTGAWAPNVDLSRASSTHFTQGDTRPYMGADTGYIYLHENGYNDDGAAMAVTLSLAPYAMHEGMQNMLLEGIQFDFFGQVGDVEVTVNTYDRLNDSSVMDTESESVTTTDGITDFRVAGRYLGLELSQDVVDGFFRLGKPVAFVKPLGMRR